MIEAAARLFKTLKHQDVVDGILDLARTMVVAEGYVVWAQDEVTENWTVMACSGLSDGWISGNTGPTKIGGVKDTNLELVDGPARDFYSVEGIQAFLVSPVVFQSNQIGAVGFFFRSPRDFATSDLQKAGSLAEMAAGALVSSKLFEGRRASSLVQIVFDSSLDYKKTLSGLPSKVVPQFSDGCAIDLLTGEAGMEFGAVAHCDGPTDEAAKQFRKRTPPPLEDPNVYTTCFNTGRSRFVEAGGNQTIADSYWPGAAMLVPIQIQGRSVGMITFVNSTSGRRFTTSDLLLAEDLARRSAQVIHSALLYNLSQETLSARDNLLAKLQKQIKQQAALMAITRQGLSQIEPTTLLDDTVFWLVKTLTIPCCFILEFLPDELFGVKASSGWGPEKIGRHLLDEPTKKLFQKILGSPSPFLFDSQRTEDPSAHLPIFKDEGIASAVVLPLKRPGGAHYGLAGVFSDIPNAFSQDDIQFLQSIANIVAAAMGRYEPEQALRINEQKYHQLFNLTPTGNILSDAACRITNVNAEALKIFGFSSDEALVGTDFRRLMFPLDGSLALDREIRDREVALVRGDGRPFLAEVSCEPVSSGGTPTGYFGIVRDITPRKELEDMKTEFITTVSHELRTPLTSIFVSLDLIAKSRVPQASDKARILLDVAYKNCQRLISLISDFLDFQKIHSADIVLTLQNTEVEPLVTQAVMMNQAYAEQYAVRFTCLSEAPGALVNLDANRFLQVMANLLSNAAKFSPSGGEVTIGSRLHDSGVRISVSNRGPMIPEASRSKLFEKFSHVDSSLNRKHRGSGLGLAISKSLVGKMGGRIDYRSDPAETVFFVDFPRLPGQPLGAPNARSEHDRRPR